MKSVRRILCALLLALLILSTCTACAVNHEKWILGTWSFQKEYHYSGVLDCTITFNADKTLNFVGINKATGTYRFKENDALRVVIGSGGFEIYDYEYDAQKGREKDSGCWCMINRDRMFMDGVMYKRVK